MVYAVEMCYWNLPDSRQRAVDTAQPWRWIGNQGTKALLDGGPPPGPVPKPSGLDEKDTSVLGMPSMLLQGGRGVKMTIAAACIVNIL